MEMKTLPEALKDLREEKKRKFSQSVDLIVNLRNFDVRKEALNTFLTFPHPTEKRVAAFLSKRSKVVPTITEEDFVKYKETKDVKNLADQYDFFIAAAPMMSKVATKFGRVFGPMNKMPSPQAGIVTSEDDAAIESMARKMKSMVRIRNKEMSIKLSVGKEEMGDKELEENIESILTQLEGKLPRGKECIKDAMVKFTMTKAIKFLDYNVKKK